MRLKEGSSLYLCMIQDSLCHFPGSNKDKAKYISHGAFKIYTYIQMHTYTVKTS